MKQNLFGTPVWTMMVDRHEDMNKELLRVAPSYVPKANYFKLQNAEVQRLKSIVLAKAQEISTEYKWKRPIAFIKGRQNPIYTNQIDSPHHHGLAKMVAVYYVQAMPNQGDILLHDPRCANTWDDPEATTEENKVMRTYHRITPSSGMLIMFPGYLIHSVEPNLTDTMRLSLAIEVYTELPTED